MFVIFQKQSVCFGHTRILYAENSNANEKTPNEKADAEINAFMSICGE